MSKSLMSSLAVGASTVALAFSSIAHAGVADDPDLAFYSRVQISNTLVDENNLKTRAQFTPARELADTVMKDIVAGLKSPPSKNYAIGHVAANPLGGTYGVTAVIPAKGLPSTTPIPVCLSSNNRPTSAWVIIQATGALEQAKLVLNSADQADKMPCYATIVVAKKEMDILLSQIQ